ncbi:choice-of-anchor P family protein [Rugosimonospora acidiphila]|uniref:Choice-of-anchor P family protein n=1 Tax=Rugosimonospora acidiphila TaxID=556531 RepID=A0ABP9SLC7_9ACTN
MKTRTFRGRALLTGVASLLMLVVVADPAAAAPGPASSYGALVNVTVAGIGVNVGPTPVSTVGSSPNNIASLNIPGVLSTGVITTSATMDNTTGDLASEASIAGLNLGLATTLTADAITADCTATSSGITGTTTLVNAFLAGSQLAVNPSANTVINVTPLITVTLNEQVNNPDGSLTVNAIHIHLTLPLSSGDIYLSSASCGPWEAPVPMASGPGLKLGLGMVGLYGVGLIGLWRRRAHLTV